MDMPAVLVGFLAALAVAFFWTSVSDVAQEAGADISSQEARAAARFAWPALDAWIMGAFAGMAAGTLTMMRAMFAGLAELGIPLLLVAALVAVGTGAV